MHRLNILILNMSRVKRTWWLWEVLEATHLGLGVGPQPGEHTGAPQLCHAGVEFVRQDNGEGHALLRLVSSIAKHQALQPQPGRLSDTQLPPPG